MMVDVANRNQANGLVLGILEIHMELMLRALNHHPEGEWIRFFATGTKL